MKFSRLLKNIFYFSESKDLQVPEYKLPDGIEDFYKIDFNAFSDYQRNKENDQVKKIKDFKEKLLSDKVKLDQIIRALDYDTSMTQIESQKYKDFLEVEDDLKKDILVKGKDFPMIFFSTVINSALINDEQRKNYQKMIKKSSEYNTKDQIRELDFYDKKIKKENERYDSLINDIKEAFNNPEKLRETIDKIEKTRKKTIEELIEKQSEIDPDLYDKRKKILNDNYDEMISDLKKNYNNENKLIENINKIEKLRNNTIKNISIDQNKAGSIEEKSDNDDLLEYARNIISEVRGQTAQRMQASSIRRAILSDLVIQKQNNLQIKKLLDDQNEYLKKIEKDKKDQDKQSKLQSRYGITNSKTLSMSSKDISSKNIVVNKKALNLQSLIDNNKNVIWKSLNSKEVIEKWEENKQAVIYSWKNLIDVFKNIKKSSLNTGFHNLHEDNQIFYRLFKDKENNLDNNDVSKQTYERILTKTFLSLLPPSMIIKIKENTSLNPENIYKKINKVIFDIEKGNLIPSEVIEAEKNIKLKKDIKNAEPANKAMKDYISLIKRQEEQDEEKLLEMEEEEQDEIERQEKELSDYMKRMSAIASGNSSPNLVFQTFNNIKSFINKIKSIKIPNKNKNSILDSIELAIMDLDQEIIGIEDVISSLESARNAINK